MKIAKEAQRLIDETQSRRAELPTLDSELMPLAQAAARLSGSDIIERRHVAQAICYLIPDQRDDIMTPRTIQDADSGEEVRIFGPGSNTYEVMAGVFREAGLEMRAI